MKRVLVTGGSRGIGAAAVRLFAADGWQVIANYCGSEEQARALAAETGCLLCRADVSDSDGRSALLAFADEALGGIDVLVNNAGVALFGLFDALPKDEVQKLYSVNLTGTVRAVAVCSCRRCCGGKAAASSMCPRSGVRPAPPARWITRRPRRPWPA